MSQELKKSMVDGGIWAASGRLVAIGSAFVLNLALARCLTPVDYGIYFVLLATMIILATVATAGMDGVVVRFVASRNALGDPAGVRAAILRCLLTVVVATTLVCVAFYPIIPWFFGDLLAMPAAIAVGGLMVAWLFVSTLQRQLAETFRGLNDIPSATLFSGFRNNGILISLFTCAMALGLWAAGSLTLRTAIAMTVLASFLVTVIAALRLRRRLPGVVPSTGAGSVDVPIALAAVLREGWPLWLVGLIAVLRAQGSGWFAAGYDTPDQVALFAIAQRFVMLVTAPLAIINSLLPPIVAGLHARGEIQRVERVVQAVGGIASLPCLLIFFMIVLLGRPMLGFLFGDHYEAAYPMLVILCIAGLGNIVTGAWQVVLPMTGHRKQMLRISLWAAAIQLVASLVGGHYWGALGVATGACAGMLVGNAMGVIMVRRQLGIWTFISIRRAVLLDAVALLAQRLPFLRPPRPRGG